MISWNIAELSQPQILDSDAFDLLPLFSSELNKAVEAFREASQTSDLTEVARLCHRMRGTAALYGFQKFADELLKVETLILSGTLAPTAILPEISEVAEGIKGFTQHHCDG